ncbi:MAG: hypothetical protein GY906_19670 [bacterium]|nr:hypothetical protein [bacterium]
MGTPLYTSTMISHIDRSLVRWDGLHLVIDVPMLEGHLGRWLAGIEQLESLRLGGTGDTLHVTAVVLWKGLKVGVECDIGEVRLKNRHLGFRLRRVSAAGAIRAPLRLIETLLSSLENELLTIVKGQGIILVDLRQWLAPELQLSILTVQVVGPSIHIWIGPGSLSDLPQPERPALPG